MWILTASPQSFDDAISTEAGAAAGRLRGAGASQAAQSPDVTKRPVFVAGDSDTDIVMLKDAMDLELVINRNEAQTMCNALANHGGPWIWEPMFIARKAKKNGADQPIAAQSEP